MQVIKWSLRAALLLALVGLSWTLFSSLIQRFDLDQEIATRLPLLQIKKKRLEALTQKQSAYLVKKGDLSDSRCIEELMNMRLCTEAYERLTQNADHPFSKGLDHLSLFIDKLYGNRMEFQKESAQFSLAHPVYMERKDLEKMAEIIENGGAFAPVEITAMKLVRKQVLGGELWELSELTCESVDGNGVCASW